LPKPWSTRRADQDLAELSEQDRDAVDLLILRIAADPRNEGHHLKGTFYCRWSAYTDTNRRVLYRIDDGPSDRVTILALPHRKKAYPRSRH
jgi:mRNA-degrading endonuclease RelE of RelBE toxin-antitoxin system